MAFHKDKTRPHRIRSNRMKNQFKLKRIIFKKDSKMNIFKKDRI